VRTHIQRQEIDGPPVVVVSSRVPRLREAMVMVVDLLYLQGLVMYRWARILGSEGAVPSIRGRVLPCSRLTLVRLAMRMGWHNVAKGKGLSPRNRGWGVRRGPRNGPRRPLIGPIRLRSLFSRTSLLGVLRLSPPPTCPWGCRRFRFSHFIRIHRSYSRVGQLRRLPSRR